MIKPELKKPKARFDTKAIGSVILCLIFCFLAINMRAFTAADADTLFDANTKAFYRTKDNGAFYRKSTESAEPADFWTEAEQMEMVLDAYQHNTNQQRLVMFTNLFRGFITEHGRTWE